MDGINFKDEAKNLDEGPNYYRPVEGNQKITFLDNGIKGKTEFTDKATGRPVVKDKVDFMIKVDSDSKEISWSIILPEKRPISKSSLYGQLMTCGAEWGELKGHSINLQKTGTGMKTRYSIFEYGEIVKKQKADGVEVVPPASQKVKVTEEVLDLGNA